MTEATLVQIIFFLCSNFNNHDDKVACFDRYNNCAITSEAKILTLAEFKKKCLSK